MRLPVRAGLGAGLILGISLFASSCSNVRALGGTAGGQFVKLLNLASRDLVNRK